MELEEIKKTAKDILGKTYIAKNGVSYWVPTNPYTFLRKIHIDKIGYDDIALALKSNTLSANELEKAKFIYDTVQDILGRLIDMSLLNPKMTPSVKWLCEVFQPAYGREKRAKQLYSNIDRAKQIKEAKNISPISILDQNGNNK